MTTRKTTADDTMDDRTNSSEPKPPSPGPQGGPAPSESAAQRGEQRNEAAANLSVKEQLEGARAERDANYDLYLRSQAELQNYRKRAQKEWDELRLYQALPLARDLLPALDNLHRALAAAS